MDYGYHNSNHVYAAPPAPLQQQLPSQPPQRQPQPQPQRPLQAQPQQDVSAPLYSSYYSSQNPNTYPYQIARQDDQSSSAVVFTDGSVVQAADPYAVETGYDGQAVSYGAYQSYHPVAPYSYAREIGPATFDQAKRKFKTGAFRLDLESKKQKVIEGGAAADAVRACTICNVVCNSDKAFASHLTGEKHVLKALGVNAHKLDPNLFPRRKKLVPASANVPKRQPPKNSAPKAVPSFFCDVCKINCNSQEALNNHKMGRKHKSNLLKLQQSLAPKPVSAPKDAPKTTPSVKEDLQTKKDKVLKCGAAVDAIMECAICDVVCNSKAVYDSHVAGKKHLALANKQEATPV